MSGARDKTPILITGAHRSGTTWVGKVLTQNPKIAYVSEPLHLNHSLGVLKQPVDVWYQYICDENGDQFYSAYQNTIRFNYQLSDELKNIKDLKSAGKLVLDLISFFSNKIAVRQVLLKDPFAVVSVPWFLKHLNAKVIVMVRHPLSFISSLQRLGWRFDFNNILGQPLLMRDYLESFRTDMIRVNQQNGDIIAQGILLWRMIYSIVDQYKDQGLDIMIVRHEDISRKPKKVFTEICVYLGIDLSENINQAILKSTQTSNPSEISENNEHTVFLNSIANLSNWKKRLTESDVLRVLSGTQDIAENYYQQEEWKEW
jgi:hypothetical protein